MWIHGASGASPNKSRRAAHVISRRRPIVMVRNWPVAISSNSLVRPIGTRVSTSSIRAAESGGLRDLRVVATDRGLLVSDSDEGCVGETFDRVQGSRHWRSPASVDGALRSRRWCSLLNGPAFAVAILKAEAPPDAPRSVLAGEFAGPPKL